MINGFELELLLVVALILIEASIDFLVKTAGIAPTFELGLFWFPRLFMAALALVFHPGKLVRAALETPPILLLAGAVMLRVYCSAHTGRKFLVFIANSDCRRLTKTKTTAGINTYAGTGIKIYISCVDWADLSG